MSGPVQFKQDRLMAAMAGVHSDDELAQTEPVATARKPAPKRKPVNVVAMAKARLREIRTELRRLKRLEKECAELERLIAAARPVAVVREIKRSAG